MPLAMADGSFLRTHDDAHSAMIANVAGDYLVLIPLSWILGLTFGLGLQGIYLAWVAFTAVLAILLRMRTRRMVASETPKVSGPG
ncbi:hypothetical protein ACFWY5_28055 [Nonomuraea sp. NPDC059007]|uniref:hypothetical protein n=1 Tax=Nonomuraea sp. NPDC059007 TaxID=3346692 RepID=UPI00367FA02C